MRLLLLVLAACGRVGFDPLGDGAASIDALDESRCSWTTPVALATLDSIDSESEPALSPDGTRIVFVSDRIGGIDRLFIATRTGTTWSSPTVIPSLDSGMSDGGPSWAASGARLYYSSYRAGPLHIYQAPVVMDNVGAPELVPGLEALAESIAPTVRADELEMFFSSRLPPSHIEYATRSSMSSPWQARGNVPELVDTLDHGYPGVSADGLTLYFEVQRSGGFSISRARRPSLTDPFGAVEQVPSIDVMGRSHGDPQPSFDGTEIVFASDRADPGNFDLYLSTRVCN